MSSKSIPNMTPEQKQRLEQIQESIKRLEFGREPAHESDVDRVYENTISDLLKDVSLLLSLIKEQNGIHLDSSALGSRPARSITLALNGADQMSVDVDLFCPDCRSEFRGSPSNIGLIHSCDNQRGSSSNRSRIALRERLPERVWLEPRAARFYSDRLSDREVKYSLVKEQEAGGITVERWLKAPMGDGIYWWRADEADNDPDIHFVQGEFFYQVGFASSETVANFGGEWLGPITPTSVARMRSACVEKVRAVHRMLQGDADLAGERGDTTTQQVILHKANAVAALIPALETLSIEQPKE